MKTYRKILLDNEFFNRVERYSSKDFKLIRCSIFAVIFLLIIGFTFKGVSEISFLLATLPISYILSEFISKVLIFKRINSNLEFFLISPELYIADPVTITYEVKRTGHDYIFIYNQEVYNEIGEFLNSKFGVKFDR